jgi:hypothetical protein
MIRSPLVCEDMPDDGFNDLEHIARVCGYAGPQSLVGNAIRFLSVVPRPYGRGVASHERMGYIEKVDEDRQVMVVKPERWSGRPWMVRPERVYLVYPSFCEAILQAALARPSLKGAAPKPPRRMPRRQAPEPAPDDGLKPWQRKHRGRGWEDMPGESEEEKKLNFALFRRDMLREGRPTWSAMI